MRSKWLSSTEKTGYLIRVMHYTTPFVILSFSLSVLQAMSFGWLYLITSFAVTGHLFLSAFTPELVVLQNRMGAKHELFWELWHRYFVMLYLYSRAFFKALFFDEISSWAVTRRKRL